MLDVCRRRGHEPTFHQLGGTYVEAGWEVERLLADADVDLCFDPGHLMIGGVTPTEALEEAWSGRDQPRAHEGRAPGGDLTAPRAPRRHGRALSVRERHLAFGQGDANIRAIVHALVDAGYSGWIVVEQDFVPRSHEDLARASADQEANLRFLRHTGV